MLSQEDQRHVEKLCAALVQAPSNSGQEGEVVKVLTAYMEHNGFDEVFVDKYGSIVGCIHGKRPGPKLLFGGHSDTVPVPSPACGNIIPMGLKLRAGVCTGAAHRT